VSLHAYNTIADLYLSARDNPQFGRYHPRTIALADAVRALAEQRYEVRPATLTGVHATGFNVIDTHADNESNSISHHRYLHEAAGIAHDLNYGFELDCIDQLTQEVNA
jgi:hypothetical protein